MSLPDEKERALNNTREWLYRLMDTKYRPKMREIRAIACRLLRHYPLLHDAEVMRRGLERVHKRFMRRITKP